MSKELVEMRYEPELGGIAPLVDFEKLIPTPGNPFPVQRVKKVLCTGPFVMVTDGSMETEYLYERHKVLDEDYMKNYGGEANLRPVLGKKEKNDYIGPSERSWVESVHGWESMTFYAMQDTIGAEELLYATPQRNVAFYAGVYVKCQGEKEAIISYDNSGSLLYLNGELIDNKPYGRMRGQTTLGHQVAVRFKDGLNLLLFKIRVGYIADNLEISINQFRILPLMAKSGNLGVTWPLPTDAYHGDETQARQMLYVFVGAFGDTPTAALSYEAKGYEKTLAIPALTAGSCATLRPGVPIAKESEIVPVHAALACENTEETVFDFEVKTTPRPEFYGQQHVFTDFHFDTTFHEEQRTYVLGAFHIVSQSLDNLRKEAYSTSTISEVDYLHPYYSIYPQDRELIRESFKNGRAESDCFYNQPNELTSSAEGLARNVIYGQKYHMEYLGQPDLVYSPGDVFGHPNQMSQLCAKGESSSCRWGKTMMGLDCAFRHMSPDGTALLHTKTYLEMEEAVRLHLNNCEHSGWTRNEDLPAYVVNEGMPWMEDSISHTHYSTITEFQRGVDEDDKAWKQETGRAALATVANDITHHHYGVMISRTDIKYANRLAENLLVSAEKFAAIAAMYGAEYPEKTLDKGWRQIVCGQHHDSVTGTNNELSFVDLLIQYREAVELAEMVLENSMNAIAEKVLLPGEKGCVVFNPHPWERTEPCYIATPGEGSWILKDEAGNEYPLTSVEPAGDGTPMSMFLPDVPAMGYKAYTLEEAAGFGGTDTDNGCTIENEYFRLTVDPALGGGIVSLWDKKENREVVDLGVDGPANRIVVLKEIGERVIAQHEFYTTGQKLFASDYRAKVSREKNEQFEKLWIRVRLDTLGKVNQEITLWHGVPRVDMKVIVEDYQSRDDLFTVTFPINVKNGKVIYDDRFAPHVSGKSMNKLSFQTLEHVTFSNCRVLPVNQWFELGPTVAVELGENGAIQAGMTAIVRNDQGQALDAADRLLEAFAKKAIPVTLYPEGDQHGRLLYLNFNEDLMNTDTRIVLQLADEAESAYARKLRGRMKAEENVEFEQKIEQEGAAVLYCVDDDNMLNKPIDVLLICAKDVKALESWIADVAAQLAQGHRLHLNNVCCLDTCPAEDDYGVAILNNGNISASVEGDNLMNLMLFHTADFYGNKGRVTGGSQLIPEQKTFEASYSLYPHAQSYREAGVYQRAMEFNDPLMGVCPEGDAQKKVLPREKSYLRCPDQFVLTCFKAGGYDMAGMSQKHRSIAERGFSMRGFEVDGKTSDVRMETGFEITQAKRVNLLEHGAEVLKSGSTFFEVTVGSHSIETYVLNPVIPETILSGALAPEAEPVQPVYLRCWEHDRGSMPIGYMAVAGVIGRKVNHISDTEFSVPVSMANNQPDARARGVMRITATEGITCDITEIPYDLAACEAQEWELKVRKATADTKGYLSMTYEDEGQCFEDIFEIGYFEPQIAVYDKGDHLSVMVKNETSVPLHGELDLASPIETWYSKRNPHALGSLSMGPVKVQLAPGEVKFYDFPWKAPDDGKQRSFWAAAKLMVNGHIWFGYTRRRGANRMHNTGEVGRIMGQENGSFRYVYEIGKNK